MKKTLVVANFVGLAHVAAACNSFGVLFAFSAIARNNAVEAVRILRAVMRGTEGNEDIFGLVAVTETDEGEVTIEAEVSGLPDGDHGFHVHQYGDVVGSTDGNAAGGHYNPNGVDHAGPDDSPRHVGDLGNIASSNGLASYNRTFEADDDSRPTIVSIFANSIIGRSFVIHAGADDLTTQPTGASGARLAVGAIGIGNHELYNEETDGEDAIDFTEHIGATDFEEPTTLVCQIIGEGVSGFGSVTVSDGKTLFGADLAGLEPGEHGYHVHWYGEEYNFQAGVESTMRELSRAGGHYNPTGVDHALPDASPRHLGDGGNIVAKGDGTGSTVVTLPDVTDLRYLVGRTCLVHADPDDGSQPAGNSGARVAAGQLGYANPATEPVEDESSAVSLLWMSSIYIVIISSSFQVSSIL